MTSFRRKLLDTLHAIADVLAVDGVLVLGSEVPNLLEPDAASTLVVSQDVDVGVPVAAHRAVKRALRGVEGLRPSAEEPSVWVPARPGLIEVNFVGIDPTSLGPDEAYVLEDAELPLLVFGALSLLQAGPPITVEGLRVPVPRPATLALEKLTTDRSGTKGERDLLVVAGLLGAMSEADLDELVERAAALPPEYRHAVRSNLTVLSLAGAREGMPDPWPHREAIMRLLARLEACG